MLEHKIDGSTVESRRHCEAADLDLEAIGVERVAVKYDPAAVANCRRTTSKCHRKHVRPRLVLDSKSKLNEETKCQETSEEAICAQTRIVAIDGGRERTLFCDFGAVQGVGSNFEGRHDGLSWSVC